MLQPVTEQTCSPGPCPTPTDLSLLFFKSDIGFNYMDPSILPKTSTLGIFIFSLVKYEKIRHCMSQM